MRARLVGINHVALEVGDLDEALRFWSELFDVKLRGRVPGMAFIDLGDQFVALAHGPSDGVRSARHFGLVVDDKEAVRARLREMGVKANRGARLDFRDPWGNLIEIVEYSQVQFTKAPQVLGGMSLDALSKTPQAQAQLEKKGLA